MSTWLIDPQGELWPEDSPHLRASYLSRLSPEDFANFAVINLGFARLRQKARGLQIDWRPTSMTGAAFAGLMLTLADHPGTRVYLSTLTQGWSHHLMPTVDSAKRHLASVFQTATCDGEGYFDSCSRRPQSLGPRDPLSRLLVAAKDHERQLSPMELWTLLDRFAESKFVLVQPRGERGPVEVIVWGKGYQKFDKGWAATMAGHDFENQPDRAYARSAAAGYRKSYVRQEPILEDVTTSTWWPGRGRTRIHYTRLLLPIRVQGRGLCILSSPQAAVVG